VLEPLGAQSANTDLPAMFLCGGTLRRLQLTAPRLGMAKQIAGGTMSHVMRVDEWFAERSARGMLTRAAGAWLLVGLAVIAARIWWSVPAAIIVFAITMTTYVAAAVRYMRRHHRQS